MNKQVVQKQRITEIELLSREELTLTSYHILFSDLGNGVPDLRHKVPFLNGLW